MSDQVMNKLISIFHFYNSEKMKNKTKPNINYVTVQNLIRKKLQKQVLNKKELILLDKMYDQTEKLKRYLKVI